VSFAEILLLALALAMDATAAAAAVGDRREGALGEPALLFRCEPPVQLELRSSISTTPLITRPDLFRPALALSSGRPVLGTVADLVTDNIPAGSILGALTIDGN
jgi:hypothetical protein